MAAGPTSNRLVHMLVGGDRARLGFRGGSEASKQHAANLRVEGEEGVLGRVAHGCGEDSSRMR